MQKLIFVTLAVPALALSISAQQKAEDAAKPEATKAKAVVSTEFAKAANLALVAIKNSDKEGFEPDKTVQTAINDADAAAISDSENAVVKDIKFQSYSRPLALETYVLSSQLAQSGGKTTTPDTEKAKADLEHIDRCIAAWRLALRKLSGDKPKECEEAKDAGK
jgi:hypothetical protein